MIDRVYSIEDIRRIVTPIAIRHKLDRVFLFGSYARGTATDNSDIDLCVDASGLKGMFALGGLYADLAESLNKKLDLVTMKSLQYNTDAAFLENVRRDGVLIYELPG